MTTLTIISCGKTKNKIARCQAKDAYIGRSFKLKKEYAEEHNPYMILSAKYGLLKPEAEIDPNYDKTIQSTKDIQVLSDLIHKQITGTNDDTFKLYLMGLERIDILAPLNYVTALSNALTRCNIYVPVNHLTKGLSQGYQIQFLSQLNKKEQRIIPSSQESNKWL